MTKVFFIDPEYIKYRKLWKEDRWKVSSDLVKLNIKSNNEGLSQEEAARLNAINRVVEENNGDWLNDVGTSKLLVKKIR